MPRAADLVAHDEALGQRAAVVRARRADGEDLRAPSRQEHRLALRVPEQHAPSATSSRATPCARSGPVSLVSPPMPPTVRRGRPQRQRCAATSLVSPGAPGPADRVDRDPAVLDVDDRDVAAIELSLEDHLGDRRLDEAPDGAPHRARAELGVEAARVEQRLDRGLAHVERDAARRLEVLAERAQHPARDLRDVRAAERREREHLVDAVVELGRQGRARAARARRASSYARVPRARPCAPSLSPKPMRPARRRARHVGAEVRRHHDDRRW